MSRSQFFLMFKWLFLEKHIVIALAPLTSTLGNEYPSSNETSKKNGTVRGDCIACDALFSDCFYHFFLSYENDGRMIMKGFVQ